ncbi:hypothetical protein [Bacillus toyonensis]|uniref:hypothetical protein n=1 Tax=Bacillus toyonensis TaxID=155322 RepID=UPI002E1B25FE|nr:hypothetical protein [Bacillus toyonensis]
MREMKNRKLTEVEVLLMLLNELEDKYSSIKKWEVIFSHIWSICIAATIILFGNALWCCTLMYLPFQIIMLYVSFLGIKRYVGIRKKGSTIRNEIERVKNELTEKNRGN